MDDLLAQLERLECAWRPPADDDSLRAAESALECAFPEELKTLYRRHDGVEGDAPCPPWRLMSLGEAIELHVEVPKQFPDDDVLFAWRPIGVRAFWSDDNANYAGLFVAGPLAGCVCFLDHDELDLSPRYRSITSFLRATLDAAGRGDDWYDMPRDWPSDDHLAADRALAGALEAEMAAAPDEWRRRQHALQVMTVLPPADTSRLVRFLDDADMWVQERAAKELGARGYAPAVPHLARTAEHGKHNARSASIGALGRLRTPEALAALVRLTEVMPAGYGPILGGALRTCGCEAEFDKQCNWRYRLPGSSEWVPLR